MSSAFGAERGANRPSAQSTELHLLQRFDAERVEALLQDFRGQVAEDQAAFASGAFAFEDGAMFKKRIKLAREFVEIITKEIRAVFICRGFQALAKVEKIFG